MLRNTKGSLFAWRNIVTVLTAGIIAGGGALAVSGPASATVSAAPITAPSVPNALPIGQAVTTSHDTADRTGYYSWPGFAIEPARDDDDVDTGVDGHGGGARSLPVSAFTTPLELSD